jgi:glycogen debranching enzyme
MTLNILEVNYSDADKMDNKTFVPSEQMPLPEWPCVLGERPQPTLTLKGDELFLITDTLGNIAGSCGDGMAASMGLFCNDTRFLSRLELQIDGRPPVLLNSTAEKGFMLSVLCTNPQIKTGSAVLRADSLGIRREMVLSSGLFEELEICNYSTSAVCFELSLSFDADFADLFEVRGSKRAQRGQILREVIEEPKSSLEPSCPAHIEELTLAYQGLDESLTESFIQFIHRQPDKLEGYTAIWQLELASHETQKLGYRLQMFTNKKLTSKVSPPATLMQAKALELLEEQNWNQQVIRIHSDDPVFNQILDRAEQDIYLLRQTFGKI